MIFFPKHAAAQIKVDPAMWFHQTRTLILFCECVEIVESYKDMIHTHSNVGVCYIFGSLKPKCDSVIKFYSEPCIYGDSNKNECT